MFNSVKLLPRINNNVPLTADCRNIDSTDLANNEMKTFKPAGDQPTEIYTYINRRNLMKLFCLTVISMGFAIGGCDFRKVDASAETNSKKESNMESIQSTTTIEHKIPPIDAATAPVIETATFALG